jgi:hypothetical protein
MWCPAGESSQAERLPRRRDSSQPTVLALFIDCLAARSLKPSMLSAASCLGESDVLRTIDPKNWMGDKGYIGHEMI